MMICTVNAIVESLLNPEGRFRTLQGIISDETYLFEPVISHSGALASFRVRWQGKPYVLKCFLNVPAGADESLCRISDYLAKVREPGLVDYHYLREEMLVFDDRGSHRSVNVVLAAYPEGIRFDFLLADAAGRRDAGAFEGLVRVFCRAASQLLASGAVHGNLKPSNIMVMPDGNMQFLNYEYMRVPGMPDYDPDRDNRAVANLALALKVLAADPGAFRSLSGDPVLRSPMLSSSFLPFFADLAGASGCEPMGQLVELLNSGGYMLRDKPALIAALDALADDLTKLDTALACKLFARLPDEDTSLPPLSAEYDWTGPLSEGLYCVERNGAWGYVGADGAEVLPFRYDWADDFRNGRAVVRIGGEFALIDKQGVEILPAIYESVDWDADYGLSLAVLDGKMGLFDRDGREVVPPTYDWVGSADSLILVRKDNLCGYIRPDGEVGIPLKFDDAFDFGSDDTALVISGGRHYYIDREGEIVCQKEEAQL